MIATTDIANIVFENCSVFGIDEMYQLGNIPEGKVNTERIVIYPKTQQPDIYWEKGFVEVNLCVPDLNNKANLIRLNKLERIAKGNFKNGIVGQFDDSWYQCSLERISIEEDPIELCCHYVNVRLLFEVLNVN